MLQKSQLHKYGRLFVQSPVGNLSYSISGFQTIRMGVFTPNGRNVSFVFATYEPQGSDQYAKRSMPRRRHRGLGQESRLLATGGKCKDIWAKREKEKNEGFQKCKDFRLGFRVRVRHCGVIAVHSSGHRVDLMNELFSKLRNETPAKPRG